MKQKIKSMRDVLIEGINKRMKYNKRIIFLSDDFGAPALDAIKTQFKDRFINVGIAEQNLINVAVGFALEGFIVYAYGITSFVTMRCYEQIRVNMSYLSGHRYLNVNLIGVGAGVSYEISGPAHHCYEDLTIIRALPNIMFFSPSDWVIVNKFVDVSIKINKPKYLRLDAKPLPTIYKIKTKINFNDGFFELIKGKKVCIVSTGYTTHIAMEIAKNFTDVGIIDIFLLKPLNKNALLDCLKKYKYIITIEEGFVNKGGLDSMISWILSSANLSIKMKNFGFSDNYISTVGDRDYLHKSYGLNKNIIKETIENFLKD